MYTTACEVVVWLDGWVLRRIESMAGTRLDLRAGVFASCVTLPPRPMICLMADDEPEQGADKLVIKPATFDELAEGVADELDEEAGKLLRAAVDGESLARAVEVQLRSVNGS